MATTISGTNGVSQVQDGIVTDGKLDLTANFAEVKEALNASGTAPIYACRAWVNFDGTGTVSIRASGNVSSITDNGTGRYIVNFTTDIEDSNYTVVFGGAMRGIGSSKVAVAQITDTNSSTPSSVSNLAKYDVSGFDCNLKRSSSSILTDTYLFTAAVFR